MSVVLVTPPLLTAISLEEARQHCHVDHGHEDEYLEGLLRKATALVEGRLDQQLITATRRWTLDRFPARVLKVPYGPLRSVTSIEYTDEAGETQTLEEYQVDADSQPGRIAPEYEQSWPSTRGVLAAVRITYQCGYGDEPADVPETIRHALALLVAHWYRFREPASEGSVSSVPLSVDALLGLADYGRYP
ncbi:MAG: head-tail connector protein [Planctomycetota bacterium]